MYKDLRVATVTQINQYLKAMFENSPIISNIWIKGEISNFKRHSMGHLYFSLKDQDSVISAVMFASNAKKLEFKPEDGQKVLLRGRIAVFVKSGQYQIYGEEMDLDGVGDLFVKFNMLKEKLGKEGLFDNKYKKPIPRFPRKIGIVTSPTGAAVRDMLNILSRRYKLCDVYIYPCLVQGQEAAKSIAQAIEYFNKEKAVDLLLVGRGGGSIEDLWAFNEEVTARAIFQSEIPIISCVGHETDFTIADFTADLRAPTPSAAAELAVPSTDELKAFIAQSESRLKNALSKLVELRKMRLKLLKDSPQLAAFGRRIDELRYALCMRSDFLFKYVEKLISKKREGYLTNVAKLNTLNPLEVLKRGYSVATINGKVIKSVHEVNPGDPIWVKIHDGDICATVSDNGGQDDI